MNGAIPYIDNTIWSVAMMARKEQFRGFPYKGIEKHFSMYTNRGWYWWGIRSSLLLSLSISSSLSVCVCVFSHIFLCTCITNRVAYTSHYSTPHRKVKYTTSHYAMLKLTFNPASRISILSHSLHRPFLLSVFRWVFIHLAVLFTHIHIQLLHAHISSIHFDNCVSVLKKYNIKVKLQCWNHKGNKNV